MEHQYGKSVTVEIEDQHALVRFDRGVNRNALDQDTILALTQVARDLTDSLEVHTVVLTGARDIFSAGIDLKDPEKWNEADLSLIKRRDIAQRGARLCRTWEEMPQLTIAAIEGFAVGGAAALAVTCDWRVAAADAVFYIPEVKVGLNLGWGAIPRLTSIIGAARTKRAILLGEKLPMKLARDWGLVDEIAEKGQAIRVATDLARRAGTTPPALLRMTKEAVNASATALNKLTTYMDADQALVCRDSVEGKQARGSVLSD